MKVVSIKFFKACSIYVIWWVAGFFGGGGGAKLYIPSWAGCKGKARYYGVFG